MLLCLSIAGGAARAGESTGSINNRDGLITIVRAPSGGKPVCARVTNDGRIHLLYDLNGAVYYAVSRDNGNTFDPPICAVDSNAKKPGLEFSGADMAVNNNGQVFVAMSTNAWKLKLPLNQWSLQFASLRAGSSAFSPVMNLNQKSSQGFSLAADDRGDVAGIWLSEKLYANFSRDGGKTFSANTEISPDCDPCPCCTTSSVFSASGELAILYREEAGNNRDMYLLVDHRDGRISRRQISTTLWKIDACPMSCFTISRAGNGFVAAWPTKGQVNFTRLDADGNQLSPGEVATGGQAIMHEGILALAAPDGKILIAWKHSSRLNWRLYDANGSASGPAGSAPGAGNWAAGVALANGRFVLFR